MKNKRVSIAKKVGQIYSLCIGRTGTIFKEGKGDYEVIIDGEKAPRYFLESDLYFPDKNTYNQPCFN